MELIDRIKSRSNELKETLIEIRTHIHKNPELSFEEYETAQLVENYLQQNLGLETQRLANTGVVACIHGKNPNKKVVALRADMDALPITEVADGRSHRSLKEGIMHACGHDVHTTSLLGAATILNELKGELEGTVKLIFQPGEERLPGGASLLIKEGVLENPKVDAIIGQHVMPLLPTGTTGFRKGLYMASTDELYCTITGKGGHGAMPHLNTDPVVVASHIIVALQQIVSRNANPILPSVLSIGKVIAEGATNVIPTEVRMEGTFRTLNEKWRSEAHIEIRKIVIGIAESMNCTAELEIRKGYPFLYNEEKLTERCTNAANRYLGAENVKELDIWMAAEDFSYYTHNLPGCFYRLGVRNEAKGIVHSVHHPAFDADMECIVDGAGLLAYLAMNELEN